MTSILWRDGTNALTLLPARGRVLQAQVRGHNAFRTPPQTSGDWNVGGDRLWVAPELCWFWKTRQSVDFEQYEIPNALDPGRWSLVRDEEGFCEMKQSIALRHQHDGREFAFEMARRIRLVSLRHSPFANCLSYHTEDELSLPATPGENAGQSIGLWSLLQVPPGGVMSVGVRCGAQMRDYFAPIPGSMWEQDENALHLRISGAQRYKIGLSPAAVTGRACYARPLGDEAVDEQLFVLREFWPQPWLGYCDVPMSQPLSQGDAIQVYNDDGSAGGFGEMEVHSPAANFGPGSRRIVSSHLTVVGVAARSEWMPWRRNWLAGQSAVC